MLLLAACQAPSDGNQPQADLTGQPQPRFLPDSHAVDRRASLMMPTGAGWFGRLSLVTDKDVSSATAAMSTALQGAGWQVIQYVRTDRVLIVMRCEGRIMILDAEPRGHGARMEITSLPPPQGTGHATACVN